MIIYVIGLILLVSLVAFLTICSAVDDLRQADEYKCNIDSLER